MKLVLSGCLLALSAASVNGCHGGEPAAPTAPQTAQAHVVESRRQQVALTVSATGSVRARETAIVSAQVPGRIQQVLVHAGDSVRAGQTLVLLDDASLRSAVDQAQAGVKAAQSQQAAAETEANLASSTLDRFRQLQSEKSVSPQEMDEVSRRAEAARSRVEAVRAQTEAARAQESGARAMLGFTRLSAPFAGVVTARLADPGTLAAPGIPILQVDQAGTLQLQVPVDESAIAQVHRGLKVRISIGGLSAISATVAEILPAADPASHSFTVKLDLPASPQFRAGLYGTADFAGGVRQATVIPRSAVVSRGSLACAYILDSQGIAQLRYLTLGATRDDLVEVLSGVSAGERLVDNPADRDLSGKRIEVQP